MKKIVIVAYSTYPNNSPRSMRTTELSEELARQGHDVTLYVLPGGYDYTSYESMTNIKIRSIGRTWLFKYSHKTGTTLNLPMKVLNRILGKFLELPRIELIRNAYRAIQKEQDIDLLITIASPYPIHWGAALSRSFNNKQALNTVWVADCGDPYMGNAFEKKPFYFKYVEKWFCAKVDYLTVPVKGAINAYYAEFRPKIKVIPQGFDFSQVKITDNYVRSLVPTFIYAGAFYKGFRDPRPLLKYLATLKQDFRFVIYTKTISLVDEYKDLMGEKLQVLNYIPRAELVFEMSKADFLVNLENPSVVQSPSKLIDYGLAKRPILSINTSLELDTDLVSQFLNGYYDNGLKIDDIEQYNIENVAKNFLDLT